jgi:hypothetical protein
MIYLVMRRPVLPEDEGRHDTVCYFETRWLAQKWIDDQKDEYFKPQDYYIVEAKGG